MHDLGGEPKLCAYFFRRCCALCTKSVRENRKKKISVYGAKIICCVIIISICEK